MALSIFERGFASNFFFFSSNFAQNNWRIQQYCWLENRVLIYRSLRSGFQWLRFTIHTNGSTRVSHRYAFSSIFWGDEAICTQSIQMGPHACPIGTFFSSLFWGGAAIGKCDGAFLIIWTGLSLDHHYHYCSCCGLTLSNGSLLLEVYGLFRLTASCKCVLADPTYAFIEY